MSKVERALLKFFGHFHRKPQVRARSHDSVLDDMGDRMARKRVSANPLQASGDPSGPKLTRKTAAV